MRIVLLGGAGYVGCVLARHLADAGHELCVIDLFQFLQPSSLATVAHVKTVDTRQLTADDFAGADAIVDLAAISNDPSGELDVEITREINTYARIRAAEAAREAGVDRYVLLSSCSVYGACDAVVDETSPLNPLTAYAASNAQAELGVLALAAPNFSVTALRLATVFGLSPSMRFDLVVNTMTLSAFSSGSITVNGGGDQFRPLIHVRDVAAAVERTLLAPPEAVGGGIFNISSRNMGMREVAAAVVAGLERSIQLNVLEETADKRNYRVDSSKMRRVLGLRADRSVGMAAATIMEALASGRLAPSPFSIRLNGYRTFVEAQRATASEPFPTDRVNAAEPTVF